MEHETTDDFIKYWNDSEKFSLEQRKKLKIARILAYASLILSLILIVYQVV
jgi:hypothetical protein